MLINIRDGWQAKQRCGSNAPTNFLECRMIFHKVFLWIFLLCVCSHYFHFQWRWNRNIISPFYKWSSFRVSPLEFPPRILQKKIEENVQSFAEQMVKVCTQQTLRVSWKQMIAANRSIFHKEDNNVPPLLLEISLKGWSRSSVNVLLNFAWRFFELNRKLLKETLKSDATSSEPSFKISYSQRLATLYASINVKCSVIS